MRESATGYLQPGEPIQAVIGAQTGTQYAAAFGGVLFFLPLNRYRIIVVTPQRIVVLDAGKWSVKRARGVVAELPRATRLGGASGIWHVIRVNGGKLRVHRRFFKDLQSADAAVASTSTRRP
ncbi:MAG: hypothetical protein ACXVXI_05445 [Mycobacteriaceae bacterium]